MRFVVSVLMFALGFSGVSVQAGEAYRLSPAIHDGTAVERLSHSGPGRWDSYLTMNLPFDPMRALLEQVQRRDGVVLKSRGEAHITVITPVEFWEVLKDRVSMDEIDAIAREAGIQESSFQVVCLGKGEAEVAGRIESTYFVVVSSDDLISIRESVRDLFVSRGGDPNAFNPRHFFPHITLGFTQRDLHESDGIIKDSRSCVAKIVEGLDGA